MSEQTLDGILSGDEEVAAQEVPQEVQEPQEAEQEAPQEEVTTGEEDTPPVSDEKQEAESWTKEMALDERRKRQEAEKRYEALEAELRKLQSPPQEPPKAPDMFEDPDGYRQHLEMQFRQRSAAEQSALMRVVVPEYAEIESIFVEAAQSDPTGQLVAALRQSENPAVFAFEMGKKIKAQREIEAVGSIDDLKAKIREELRQEMLQGQSESQPRDAKGKFVAPPSLATARASAPNKEVGTESLHDLTRLG